MEVSPGEVHDLYNEGLSAREIARRLKISRTWVKFKLREYELDKREYELDNREREVDIKEADLEAREKEIDKIPELEEKAHLLNSQVDSSTKKNDELEEEIRSKEGVLEEIKNYEEKREEKTNQLSNLSKYVDLQKKSAEKFDETQKQLHVTQKQIKTESLTLRRIKDAIDINRHINMKLVEDKFRLEEETRVKKKAINEIEQSYYGFAERTKQIALFMPAGSDTKIKTHEETRKKVLKGMEMIAEEAKISKPEKISKPHFESDLQAIITKPDVESDLQAFLRDQIDTKKDFAIEHHPTKTSRSRTLRG